MSDNLIANRGPVSLVLATLIALQDGKENEDSLCRLSSRHEQFLPHSLISSYTVCDIKSRFLQLSTGSQPERPTADTVAHVPAAYRFSLGAVSMPLTMLRARLGSVMTTPAALLQGHLRIEVEIRRCAAGNQSRPTIER